MSRQGCGLEILTVLFLTGTPVPDGGGCLLPRTRQVSLSSIALLFTLLLLFKTSHRTAFVFALAFCLVFLFGIGTDRYLKPL